MELVKKQYVDALNKEQREFDNLILQYYATNGFKELGSENLEAFIKIKYNSTADAKEKLQMSVADIRAHYIELQRKLYTKQSATPTINVTIENHYHGNIDTLNINNEK